LKGFPPPCSFFLTSTPPSNVNPTFRCSSFGAPATFWSPSTFYLLTPPHSRTRKTAILFRLCFPPMGRVDPLKRVLFCAANPLCHHPSRPSNPLHRVFFFSMNPVSLCFSICSRQRYGAVPLVRLGEAWPGLSETQKCC